VTFFLEAGLVVVIKVGPDFLLREVDKQCSKINVMGPNKNALDPSKKVEKSVKMMLLSLLKLRHIDLQFFRVLIHVRIPQYV